MTGRQATREVGGGRRQDMVAENGGSESSECDVRRDFYSSKGVALGIRQAWRGRGR